MCALSYPGRIRNVSTTKLSVTVEEDLAEELRDRAGTRGVSAFVNQAVRHELEREQLAELLADLEEDLGPPDEVMVTETLASLDRLDAGTRSRSKSRRRSTR
jgi:post-segregation antitoxin (ccd killing protein)